MIKPGNLRFTLVYHPLVVSHDIPKLATSWKTKIRLAIEQRLTEQPELYGKPLRKSLQGYRKLRVSDYRVIFRIENETVKILMIAHRSVVYDRIHKRT